MTDTHVALKDANSVASAIFESSTSPGVILRGKIDEITGRVLVDNAASGGGTGTWYSVSGTIDGTNPTFTLPVTPASDFVLVLGGQTQIKGKWYTVSTNTITYQAGYIPIGVPTDEHKALVIS